jgi:hypothetical protein
MKKFLVEIRTQFETKVLTVRAASSADALLKLADRIPLFGAAVKVVAL